jgi:CheY-like chemotaxis protein
VLIVEDEPYMAEAIRDGLRLEAIAADIAGDGDTALELLSVNAYDIAVVDRDIRAARRTRSLMRSSVRGGLRSRRGCRRAPGRTRARADARGPRA